MFVVLINEVIAFVASFLLGAIVFCPEAFL